MSEVAETTATIQSEDAEIVRPQAGELQNIHAAYRLNGKNYLKWSQLVRTVLKEKGKISHILGTGPKPEDPRFGAWDEEDSMIMAWLWNSMHPEISDTCMVLATAKDVWDAIQETYSKAKDAAQGENSVMEDKDKAYFLLLDLPSSPLHVSRQPSPMDVSTEPTENVPPTEPIENPNPEPPVNPPTNPALDSVRFGKGKVFSRRKKVVPEFVQVQDSNLNLENEVTISNPSFQSESEINNDDHDLPIAIRKGVRECTNRPLYPLAHFLSFKHFSPSHRAFLVSLNTIAIPAN
ncbi:hypothetical protein L484_009968 [Morus notabilis]|uniref:Retrotransposon Copia-like N-terminal domain-containing protein n=1 Tax=Morus notabilis TaxID=981085 RepID=W9S2Z8_9ROSA|nr:hypothetical protein L484_009968 [Morus notabilis]